MLNFQVIQAVAAVLNRWQRCWRVCTIIPMHEQCTEPCLSNVQGDLILQFSIIIRYAFMVADKSCLLHKAAISAAVPAGEKILSMCWEVATAEKLWPAVTAVASSPGGRLTCQSLLAAQLSKGRYMIVLGASLLDLLPYITPCRTSQSLMMTVRNKLLLLLRNKQQQQQQPPDRVTWLISAFCHGTTED